VVRRKEVAVRDEPAIVASGLSKRYGGVLAVDRVDLRIEPGTVYALLGLNGAGKTTIIRMLLALIAPSSGSVVMLGTAVAASASRLWADVGYLVETPSAYPDLTVVENLDLVRRLRRLPAGSCVNEIVDRLSLTPYAHRRAGALSLGNAQRLGLAKALIHRPRLLILDEPANGLDPAGVVEIRTLLLDLARRDGVTILLSSHILTEVARLATRIGILHAGRMLTEFDADDVASRLRRTLTVSTRDNAHAADVLRAAGHDVRIDADNLVVDSPDAFSRPDAIADLLVRAGHPPNRLVAETEDLEDYFLRLVGIGPDGMAS
jgi:ABC-2 type transport system ATP-binding protein